MSIVSTASNVGIVAGTAVAMAAFLRLPLIRVPTRWVFRSLVSDPVSRWARSEVSTIVGSQTAILVEGQATLGVRLDHLTERTQVVEKRTLELVPNDGKSIKDRSEQLIAALTSLSELGGRVEAAGIVSTAQGDRMEAAGRVSTAQGDRMEAVQTQDHAYTRPHPSPPIPQPQEES